MKKYVLGLLFIVISAVSLSQVGYTKWFTVPDKATAFSRPLPLNTLVWEIDSIKFYRLTAAVTAVNTMADVFTSGDYEEVPNYADNDFWQRIGTTLSPVNIGDDLEVVSASLNTLQTNDGTYLNIQDDVVIDSSLTAKRIEVADSLSTNKIKTDIVTNNDSTDILVQSDVDIEGYASIRDSFNVGGSEYVDSIMSIKDMIGNIGSDIDTVTGDYIVLDGDVEVTGNTYAPSLTQEISTITDNDDTPDVSGGDVYIYGGSANSVIITDLDNPKVGNLYVFYGNSDTYTITFNPGGNFKLDHGVEVELGEYDKVVFRCIADNVYVEESRIFSE